MVVLTLKERDDRLLTVMRKHKRIYEDPDVCCYFCGQPVPQGSLQQCAGYPTCRSCHSRAMDLLESGLI